MLSVKTELLNRLVIFGEDGLRRALSEYVEHYHEERAPQAHRGTYKWRKEVGGIGLRLCA